VPGPGGTPYVTQAQLSNYWPAPAFNGITIAQQDQACLDATGEVDGRISGRYQMPLLAWGNELTKVTAWIAIYLCFSTRGFNPQNGSDRTIQDRYWEMVGNPNVPGSIGWLDKVQRQSIHPDITATVPPNQSPTYNLPQVYSGIPRGWTRLPGGGL
jgi:phage gp36-like protein